MSEEEMFTVIKSGKRRKKAWKRVINKISFVGLAKISPENLQNLKNSLDPWD